MIQLNELRLFDNEYKLMKKNQTNYENLDIVGILVDNKYKMIKRIIATEGQTIEIIDGSIYVNDEKLIEDYIYEEEQTFQTLEKMVIKKDHVFVLGDNRNISMDSRSFNQIHVNDIIGIIIN